MLPLFQLKFMFIITYGMVGDHRILPNFCTCQILRFHCPLMEECCQFPRLGNRACKNWVAMLWETAR